MRLTTNFGPSPVTARTWENSAISHRLADSRRMRYVLPTVVHNDLNRLRTAGL
jgi:hypothetical protein